MELYSYQKELLNSTGKKVYINWCRGAGLTTALAYYILENKPKNVFLDAFSEERHLIDKLEELERDYNIEVKSFIASRSIEINFVKTGQKIVIHKSYLGNVHYDLVISKSKLVLTNEGTMDSQLIKTNTFFSINTGNINDFSLPEFYNSKSIVDYKEALKEGQLNIENIIEYAASCSNKDFCREFAILDKPKKEEMSYEVFAKEALQRLQKQFLEIPTNKDTVLTRKNIIEMIKDIKQMEKQ